MELLHIQRDGGKRLAFPTFAMVLCISLCIYRPRNQTIQTMTRYWTVVDYSTYPSSQPEIFLPLNSVIIFKTFPLKRRCMCTYVSTTLCI